jgi:hypothetical protein
MLAGAKWFSTQDLKSDYWQVDLHLDNKEKILLSMGQVLWQFTVMPFGLCDAPATFERLMETALRGLMTHVLCTWMTWSSSAAHFQKNLLDLQKVFQRFHEAHL